MASFGSRSSNPVFRTDAFQSYGHAGSAAGVMTVQGAALKALALTVLMLTAATWSWKQVEAGEIQPGFMIGTLIGAAVVGLVTSFKPTWAGFTAPIYAVLEGLCLGAISVFFSQRYQGIVIQAIGLTGGTLAVMLFLYGTRMVRVTDKLRTAIISATCAIALVYLVSMVLGFFGVQIPYIHASGKIGIVFSLFVVGLAAFNLLLDFDIIERGAAYGAPKYMEWYSAFGLLVTLVWLYIEILDLLRKLSDRR